MSLSKTALTALLSLTTIFVSAADYCYLNNKPVATLDKGICVPFNKK